MLLFAGDGRLARKARLLSIEETGSPTLRLELEGLQREMHYLAVRAEEEMSYAVRFVAEPGGES